MADDEIEKDLSGDMEKIIERVLIALIFVVSANAQTLDDKWGVGLNLGSQHYSGEYGNGLYNPFQGEGLYELILARNINEKLDLVLNLGAGEVGYGAGSDINFHRNLYQMNLSLKYYVPKTLYQKYSTERLNPFVFGGFGVMRFAAKKDVAALSDLQLPNLGLGAAFELSPGASLVLKETFVFSNSDGADNQIHAANDFYVQHAVGIVFNFGDSKDTDGDGVSDKRDECPEVYGVDALNGCPDTDGDGIADKDDACPNESGPLALDGCPDDDGDGIANWEDPCPDEIGSEELNGCPDIDNDGLPDKYDECPSLPGLLKNKGCPDTDGDGIPDKDDACPGEPGLIENKGCPEIEEETTQILEEALGGVQFQYGGNVLTQSSHNILDNLADILVKHPEYKLSINGHTDSRGNDNGNLRLSQERADAVLQFMLERDIAAERMIATGIGEAQPIADNGTADGRATNRRVELIIEF